MKIFEVIVRGSILKVIANTGNEAMNQAMKETCCSYQDLDSCKEVKK